MESMHHFFMKQTIKYLLSVLRTNASLFCIYWFFPLLKLVTEGLYPTDNRFRARVAYVAPLKFQVMHIFACHYNINRITDVC